MSKNSGQSPNLEMRFLAIEISLRMLAEEIEDQKGEPVVSLILERALTLTDRIEERTTNQADVPDPALAKAYFEEIRENLARVLGTREAAEDISPT